MTAVERQKLALLKQAAELGYNVGFGAKKNFASFDIASTLPSLITFVSLAIGILSLVYEGMSAKHVGAMITIVGISGVYLDAFKSNLSSFEDSGHKLTNFYNEISGIYYKAKLAETSDDLAPLISRLEEISKSYTTVSNSKQVMFSSWYAHYKFFWEHQIDWIDEQKNFRLLRDKLPLSFSFFSTLLLGSIIVLLSLS